MQTRGPSIDFTRNILDRLNKKKVKIEFVWGYNFKGRFSHTFKINGIWYLTIAGENKKIRIKGGSYGYDFN